MEISQQDNLIGTLCKDCAGYFIVLSRHQVDDYEYNVFSIRDAVQHAGKDYVKAFTVISNQYFEHVKIDNKLNN